MSLDWRTACVRPIAPGAEVTACEVQPACLDVTVVAYVFYMLIAPLLAIARITPSASS